MLGSLNANLRRCHNQWFWSYLGLSSTIFEIQMFSKSLAFSLVQGGLDGLTDTSIPREKEASCGSIKRAFSIKNNCTQHTDATFFQFSSCVCISHHWQQVQANCHPTNHNLFNRNLQMLPSFSFTNLELDRGRDGR